MPEHASISVNEVMLFEGVEYYWYASIEQLGQSRFRISIKEKRIDLIMTVNMSNTVDKIVI